jgi:hypothetical protein
MHKEIIKSFCGVQGRFFQKEPLAIGGVFNLLIGDHFINKHEKDKKFCG